MQKVSCVINFLTSTSCSLSLPIVFKWIVRGFSGYLVPDQLFHLWDVILAWESLEVLPVLALAVVSFRRENLMDVTSQLAAEVGGLCGKPSLCMAHWPVQS